MAEYTHTGPRENVSDVNSYRKNSIHTLAKVKAHIRLGEAINDTKMHSAGRSVKYIKMPYS